MEQSTLKKMSEVLGISISTVSRALKDHPDISERTKQRVKELAEALEYEPNTYAIQLRTRQSNVLGILVPYIDNFFYDSFIAAVEEEARIHGYSVMIMQSRDSVLTETSNIQLFKKSMISGLFISVSVETEDLSMLQKIEDKKVPVIYFDRVVEGDEYHKVCLEDARAASIAAETLIAAGKKNILALFGHPHLSISQERCQSFVETFMQKAPDANLIIKYPETTAESEKVVMKAFAEENKPDAVFCMGDLILMGVMHAVHALNLHIPDDVGIITISNGLIPTLYNPKITYVETSGYKLGKLAFDQMLMRLNGGENPGRVNIESVLVKGGSL